MFIDLNFNCGAVVNLFLVQLIINKLIEANKMEYRIFVFYKSNLKIEIEYCC